MPGVHLLGTIHDPEEHRPDAFQRLALILARALAQRAVLERLAVLLVGVEVEVSDAGLDATERRSEDARELLHVRFDCFPALGLVLVVRTGYVVELTE